MTPTHVHPMAGLPEARLQDCTITTAPTSSNQTVAEGERATPDFLVAQHYRSPDPGMEVSTSCVWGVYSKLPFRHVDKHTQTCLPPNRSLTPTR